MFNIPANVIVIPVNCVGVLGCGIAKEFKENRGLPNEVKYYYSICRWNYLRLGYPLLYSNRTWQFDKISDIVFFPTKHHFNDKSNLVDVDLGLENFVKLVARSASNQNYVINMPALGCGAGGLSWDDVKPLMKKHLANLPCRVNLFLPGVKTKQKRKYKPSEISPEELSKITF